MNNLKTQKQIVAELLVKYTRVSLQMMADNRVLYTSRNRISELRKEGWKIRTELGKRPSENAWILEELPEHMKPKNPWLEISGEDKQLRFA